MLVLILAIVAIIVGSCLLMIGPTVALSRRGFSKTSLAVAVATTSALVIDYLYNWEGLDYPHWLLGAPTWLFPLTLLVGIAAIGFALKAILDRMYDDS